MTTKYHQNLEIKTFQKFNLFIYFLWETKQNIKKKRKKSKLNFYFTSYTTHFFNFILINLVYIYIFSGLENTIV